MFKYLRNCQTVFQRCLHTTLNSYQFFYILINTYCCLFYYSHSSLYEMASYCGFDLYFPLLLMILMMFSVLIGHLYIIFYIKLFPHHLLKRLFFSPLKFLGILITNKLPSNMWASFWLSILFYWSICPYLFQSQMILFILALKSWYASPPTWICQTRLFWLF